MIVRLRLSDGRKVYTELTPGDGDKRKPLEVLKDILENNATGWLGASSNASLTGTSHLVSARHIVTAELA